MADELGTAVLRINVDLKSFEQDLGKARALVEKQKPINFRLDVSDAQQQFRKLEASAKTLESQFKKLLGTPLNLNSKNLEKLGADALKAGTSINDYTRAVINGGKPLANSIASLQQQGAAFRTLAANVKIGSAEFRNFTQAAAQAGQKQLFGGLEEIKSLESLFKLGAGSGGLSSFKGTDQLLTFSRSIGDSPAAIQLYIQALQQAASVTSVTDAKFGKLTAEIERQANALERAQSAASRYNQIFGAGPKALPPGRGPSQFVFTGEETPEERRARERQQRRMGKIQGIQDYASTGGRDSLAGFGRLLAAPNADAIKAEQQLGKERLKTADSTLKSAAEERNQRKVSRSAVGKRLGGAASSGLIGGGFPLLFGQGPGASLGGAAGGLIGGAAGGGFGFGLSVVGTAIGQAFDEALAKGKTLAAGLSDPIGKFEELRQAGLISSKALEKNVASLITQGREAEAAAKIQLDLSSNFGDTSELTALNDAYDELSRSFAQLSVLTAKYVAGPLADFLSKLAASFNAISSQKLLDERRTGASAEVRSASIERVRARKSELFTAGGLTIGQATAQANEEELATLDKVLGKTRQRLQAEAASATAIARQNTIRSLSFRQIDAQVQGYERLGLELEKQRIEQQRLQDLSVPKADAESINREAAQATYRVQAQINDLAKERLATANLEAAQNALALQAVQQRLAAAQQLAGVEQGVVRSTLEQVLNIRAGVDEAKRRERDLGAQIDSARLRGGDAGEVEASRLVGQQKVAAEETKAAIIAGAAALNDASQNLRDAFREGVLRLTAVRSDPKGLNQFLDPQQQENRARADFQRLQPSLREAQNRFRRLTGAEAPSFGRSPSEAGSFVAETNESIRNFIRATTDEFNATKELTQTQNALTLINEELVSSNKALIDVTNSLASKTWNVQVNVAADGTASAFGDIYNGAISP